MIRNRLVEQFVIGAAKLIDDMTGHFPPGLARGVLIGDTLCRGQSRSADGVDFLSPAITRFEQLLPIARVMLDRGLSSLHL